MFKFITKLIRQLKRRRENEPYYCSECGTKTATYKASIEYWEPDQEPYVSGVEEEIDELHSEFYVCAAICPNCKRMKWLSIEEATNVIEEVYNHTKE